MFKSGNLYPQEAKNSASAQLDRFVQEHQLSLAALVWGLRQEWEEEQSVLGIDLKPQPHFVRCSRTDIEELNHKLDRKIQEILGILDGHNPEQEIAMIGIGDGQIKLIYFQPSLQPSACFAQLDRDLDSLIQQLEERLLNIFLGGADG
jgi:hypothetical protein